MFFITGLPRSRTAWFAALFNSCGFFCYHELLKDIDSKEDFENKMSLDFGDVGNSDCGLFMTDFQERFKSAKTVIIHRDVKEVSESLKKKCLDVDLSILESISSINKSMDGFHVNYNEINSKIEDIFEYCVNRKLDQRKKKLFLNLNIQACIDLNPGKNISIWS